MRVNETIKEIDIKCVYLHFGSLQSATLVPVAVRDAPSGDVSDLANKVVIETCNKQGLFITKVISAPHHFNARFSFRAH